MAKLIKGNKKNFTVIDNTIFKDTRLSLKDKGLFCQMISLPDNWNFSIKGITALCDDGKDSIRAGMENLEKYGYLTRKQARDEGGSFSGYDYYIYQNPEENPDFNPSEEDPLMENPLTDESGSKSPLSENPTTVNPTTGNPTSDKPTTAKPTSGNPTQYSTKELSTQESSTIQSIKDLINTYESDSGADTDKYSEEEIMAWDDDEFYRHLNKKEYEAFIRLFEASIRGEIRSSKESLIEYFKKMKARGWKDSSNRRIRNIEGYVRMNFDLYTENQRYKRQEDK